MNYNIIDIILTWEPHYIIIKKKVLNKYIILTIIGLIMSVHSNQI